MEKLLSDMGFVAERVLPVQHDIPWKSLTATHKLCLETIARETTTQYICVFEDDADLAHGVERGDARRVISQYLALLQGSQKDRLEYVKLGACLDLQQVKDCTPHACQSWCTHAYMVTPLAARRLLQAHGHNWLNYHSDYAYMNFAASPPLVGHEFAHDHTHPRWHGLFFQARRASWYETGMSEKGHNGSEVF